MSYFLGIGAQKAATSWLHAMLARHPQIQFPLGKEAHYWNRQAFREHPDARWVDDFPDAEGRNAIGEITPAYALLEDATIEAIAARCPELRIFISLRDPVERAWSAALMAMERAEMTLDETSDRWFLDHFRSAGSLGRGAYLATLDRWERHFPGAVRWLLYDDIVAAPRRVLGELAKHLGVPETPFDDFDARVLEQPIFEGRACELRPSLREPLRELYREATLRLGERLDRDLSHWGDIRGATRP